MSARRLGAGLTAAALAIGAVLVAVGAVLTPERTVFAWHAAFVWCWTVCIGLLAWVVIHHLTNSSWFIVLRRQAELGWSPLLLLPFLFLPAAFLPEVLFGWARPVETLPHHVSEWVEKTQGYLNVPFFLVRAGLFFAVWVAAAALLRRLSLAQDEADDDADAGRLARRQRRVAILAVVPFGFAVHFASVDWVMSLTPAWTSSAFGLYVFAGSLVAGLAVLILLAFMRQRSGALRDVVGVSHFHGLGKLLLTFILFWAYIGFFQYLLIWIGDIPREVAWYVPRVQGAWRPWALALALGHFALPFFALLSRSLKRRPAALAGVAAWMLLLHALDVYWVVMPNGSPGDAMLQPVDVGAFLLLPALCIGFAWWRAREVSAAPRRDPRFRESLRFETR